MDYTERTRQNVIAADGTLILGPPRLSGGSLLTLRMARELQKPFLAIKMPEMASGVVWDSTIHRPLSRNRELPSILIWLSHYPIRVLNVAGPRASKVPAAYEAARSLLQELFQRLGQEAKPPRSAEK
ncbi:Putative molybdenum carrier [Pirellula sp. SH-Sr6A]|nr:Putative molybdenum carrier [Pirellula sp. SH-Sr6A]